MAKDIRAAIFKETNLTASAGVSVNKFLAKMASGKNKPDDLTVILPEDAEAFVEKLPIEKFHGIGEVTAAKMHSLGIRTRADLKRRSPNELVQHFGKSGQYYKIAKAQDDRPVEANRIRKSIGAETSFAEDLSDLPLAAALRYHLTMLLELEQIAQILFERLESH